MMMFRRFWVLFLIIFLPFFIDNFMPLILMAMENHVWEKRNSTINYVSIFFIFIKPNWHFSPKVKVQCWSVKPEPLILIDQEIQSSHFDKLNSNTIGCIWTYYVEYNWCYYFQHSTMYPFIHTIQVEVVSVASLSLPTHTHTSGG